MLADESPGSPQLPVIYLFLSYLVFHIPWDNLRVYSDRIPICPEVNDPVRTFPQVWEARE